MKLGSRRRGAGEPSERSGVLSASVLTSRDAGAWEGCCPWSLSPGLCTDSGGGPLSVTNSKHPCKPERETTEHLPNRGSLAMGSGFPFPTKESVSGMVPADVSGAPLRLPTVLGAANMDIEILARVPHTPSCSCSGDSGRQYLTCSIIVE